jgi:SiaC family regulatory phosphoprotein
MEELRILRTKNMPEVLLSAEGRIKIKGRSIHENVTDFYVPIEEWISEYILDPANVTIVDLNLEYFNSASAKVFVHLLQKISYVTLKHKKYTVNWYYEDGDDDILERGEYFSNVLDIPFNYIKIT